MRQRKLNRVFGNRHNTTQELARVRAVHVADVVKAERSNGCIVLNDANYSQRKRLRPNAGWLKAGLHAQKPSYKPERKNETLPGNPEALVWAARNCAPQHNAHVVARNMRG